MTKLLIFITGVFLTVSIYTITSENIDGGQINFSSFQGKKILIVNTASNSPYVSQYTGLEQLYQQYHDSLVVIAFPSNSFGNEPGTNQEIKNFVMSTYNVHFLLGAKVPVTGVQKPAIYQWLTQQVQNGMMNSDVLYDFQKYLIDDDGTLIAVFGSNIHPMDSTIQNAITNN